MDCVLGYFLNPQASGVAKFNSVLAEHLNVPVLSVFDGAVGQFNRLLLSLKMSEMTPEHLVDFEHWWNTNRPRHNLSLFLHNFTDSALEIKVVKEADAVYCGNAELVAQLKPWRDDAIELWCPGTILDTRRFPRPELSVFSFGMAHKIRANDYRKLRDSLEATGKTYALFMSTALHASRARDDDTFRTTFKEIEDIFAGAAHFVGYLSDEALYNRLMDTTFFAAFFDKGVRANNTSVNTAMECGAVVITNLDEFSPASFVHMANVIDVNACQALPTDPATLGRIRDAAKATATTHFSWERLTANLRSST